MLSLDLGIDLPTVSLLFELLVFPRTAHRVGSAVFSMEKHRREHAFNALYRTTKRAHQDGLKPQHTLTGYEHIPSMGMHPSRLARIWRCDLAQLPSCDSRAERREMRSVVGE